MNDRKLLELAAKAAGLVFDMDCDKWFHKDADDGDYEDYWNPLTNDGDALRLAVKLGIHVMGHASYENCVAEHEHQEGWIWIEEQTNPDPYAATRRAIVRTAAEIGKGMK